MHGASESRDGPRPDLLRGIRRWDLVAVAINGIIGAGIFGLPARTFALIGTYSLFAFGAFEYSPINDVAAYPECRRMPEQRLCHCPGRSLRRQRLHKHSRPVLLHVNRD